MHLLPWIHPWKVVLGFGPWSLRVLGPDLGLKAVFLLQVLKLGHVNNSIN